MIFTSFMNDYFIKGGLQKGDKVLLHSNLKCLFKSLLNKKIIFNVGDIADSILEFLGPKGTLVLPTFNFDFCNGKPFSFLDTQSQMGIFSEFFRNKNKLNRTWHPVYSFSIHGNIPVDELKKIIIAHMEKIQFFIGFLLMMEKLPLSIFQIKKA